MVRTVINIFSLIIVIIAISCPPPQQQQCNSNNAGELQNCITIDDSGSAAKTIRNGSSPSSPTPTGAQIRFSDLKVGSTIGSVLAVIANGQGDATSTYNVFANQFVSIFTEIDPASQGASRVFFQLIGASQYIEFVYAPPIPAGTIFRTTFMVPDYVTSGQITAKISIEGTVAGIYSNSISVILNIVSQNDQATPPSTVTITTQTTLAPSTTTLGSTTTSSTLTTSTTQTTTITSTSTSSTLTSTTTSCQAYNSTLYSTAVIDGYTSSTGSVVNNNLFGIVGDNNLNTSFRTFYSFDISSLSSNLVVGTATLNFNISSISGNPTIAFSNIRVDHIDIGPTLDLGDHGLGAIEYDIATQVFSIGAKNITVTAQLQADINAMRTRSQYRFWATPDSDNDGVVDQAILDTNESGNLPSLQVSGQICF